MPLTSEQKRCLESKLNKCDAALADKPMLASIYNQTWRQNFRNSVLAVDKLNDVKYPDTYAVPIFEGLFPPCFQYRLEEGASILLPKLKTFDRNNLINRMRETNCLSGEDELLLARGFANEFDESAIHTPTGNASAPRPEFTVKVDKYEIAIEAKVLLDSQKVQQMNRAARQIDQNFWFCVDQSIADPQRVRNTLAKKVLKSTCHSPCIIVLTIYSGFDIPAGLDLARQIAITPDRFNISTEEYPFAVALVCDRLIQGGWFNSYVTERIRISDENKDRIRKALKDSFYSRNDGIFLHEGMTDEEHKAVLDKMSSEAN